MLKKAKTDFRSIRAVIVVLVLLLTPVLASAANMQVTSSALPATGGSITPNGLKFFSGAANYTITVNAGWSISNILIDGVATAIATAKTVPFDSSKAHTIKVTFNQGIYSITTSAGPGGQLQITGGGATNITAGCSRSVIVAPSTGYRIHSYLVDGGAPVVPADPTVAATIPFTNITANHTVSATFDLIPVVTVYAGPVQSVTANGNAPWSTTLNGSASSNAGAIAYQWNLVSYPVGATAGFSSPTSATTPISMDKAGNYSVTLTATSGGLSVTSASTTITVIISPQEASRTCILCHAGQAQVTGWLASIHAISPNGPSCPACHMPNQEAHHGISQPIDSCLRCHTDSQGNVPDHPFSIGTNDVCVACHNPHSTVGGMTQGAPHYNNITSGMYPASYVTSRATCMDCHYTNGANATIRHQWYSSGHANVTSRAWINYDFKTKDGCVQCHTTTGFITYSTGKVTTAWGAASDKTKEVLTCKGCHKDVDAGIVRTVAPVRPYADETGYTNRNVGTSNICMDCHSGNNNGQSIAVKLAAIPAADFSALPFVAPHNLTAGGTLHGRSGYHFPGRTYAFYSSNSHRLVGIGNYNGSGAVGPCVACHKSSINGHTFKAAVIDLCSNCHSSSLSDTELQARASDVANALNILKAALADKGFVYQTSYPYFFNQNWGVDQAGANVMGAAFNYKLLLSEPGAYAHNAAYAKTLITDSIDAAYNGGTVTGSIDAALEHLVGKGVDSGGITQEQADNFQSYKANSNCTTCHNPNTGGRHSAHLNASITCNACHSTSAMTNAALISGTLTHANGVVDVIFAPELNGNYNATTGTCSALYCHGDGTSLATGLAPVNSIAWNGGGLSCTSCHGNPPSYANGTPKANSHSKHTFGCNTCHAGTTADGTSIRDKSQHANRRYDLTPGAGASFTYVYAANGGSCSSISCHHNGTATWGTTLGCDGCHDAPPATASHLKHYGGTVAQAAYGDTRIAKDFSGNAASYIMNCGNCHPMNTAKHMNGVVDVELYNPLEPAGSLKALNPASAAYVAGGTNFTDNRGLNYTKGTCSNVYCHSYNDWTTSAAISENDPNWQAKVVTTRKYKTITWGGAPLTCSGCHGNPTQTSFTTNDGGAGDSHSWIDPYGYQNLHIWNMGYAPLSCMYCHNDTVKQLNTFTEDVMGVRTLSNVPISNFSKHVNGSNDIAFDKQNPFVYATSGGNVSMSLSNATYDPVTKNCSNVSCHIQQITVPWGKPYRWYNYDSECDSCHGYAGY